jgi:hypothetical protein
MAQGPGFDTPPAAIDGVRDAFAGQPIRGEAVLRIEDFKSAWFAMPQVRKMIAWYLSVAVCTPLLIWTATEAPNSVVAIAIPIIFCAAVYGLLRGRRRWAEASLRGHDGTVEYLFDHYGYQLKAPGRESRSEWSKLHGHLELAEAFLVYITPNLLTLVPKRAFAAADQVRLRQELEARIPRRPASYRGVLKLLLAWLLLTLVFLAVWQLVLAPSTR